MPPRTANPYVKIIAGELLEQESSTPRAAAPGTFGSVRLMGVPIRLHFTFVLLVICLIVFGLSSNQSPTSYTLFLLAVIVSVLLHECGHAVVSSLYRIRTLEIVMYPIGGVARLERPAQPWEEFWMALSGPVVNLLIAGSIFALLYSEKRSVNLFALTWPSDANLAERIALANLILAGFNLLPAFPMDGGRMLRAVLSRLKSEYEATRIATSGPAACWRSGWDFTG
ncbi:MAG: site-2 protease family protein [Bryobacteraceae bacterium]